MTYIDNYGKKHQKPIAKQMHITTYHYFGVLKQKNLKEK